MPRRSPASETENHSRDGAVSPAAVPLEQLHPAPGNPRTIKDERCQNLVRSIQADADFLWRRPILATSDGTPR